MLEKNVHISWKISMFLLLFQLQRIVTEDQVEFSKNSSHLCYTCMEPLVGYTDHSDSCKYLNISSPLAASFIKTCTSTSLTNEYECRKVVVSYRSVETFLRRDCVPKGQCSWKDRTQAMVKTPVSNCVYTDERSHKLECIYCCDESLCNRMMSRFSSSSSIVLIFCIFIFLSS